MLAIELPRTGKVLLFTGDAQRGSWVSWGRLKWKVGGRTLTARELLGRTVFYKVGHHGSHNATLDGRADDPHANLEWLGQGRFGAEFVAMIPANKPWAEGKKPRPWKHPLKAIEDALLKKASGRVLRMDPDRLPDAPAGLSPTRWAQFTDRAEVTKLYAQCTVMDE